MNSISTYIILSRDSVENVPIRKRLRYFVEEKKPSGDIPNAGDCIFLSDEFFPTIYKFLAVIIGKVPLMYIKGWLGRICLRQN